MPESTPPVRVTPDGRAPMLLKVGAGKPCALRVSEPALPTVKVALFALVNDGASSTVRVNVWVASLPMPFEAVRVTVWVPPVSAAGVPEIAPAVKVTPDGRPAPAPSVGTGKPVAVIVNVPGVPATKVEWSAELICGASSTVRVKPWTASGPKPFDAVRVKP